MLRLFLRHSLRHFARHRLLTALNILGIALGVTVFVSVQIVNRSALESFRASVDIVAGRANLEVHGDGLDLDENVYPVIREHAGIAAATPVIVGVATLPDFPGEYLRLLGLDLFSNRPFRTFELRDAAADEARGLEFLADPQVLSLSVPLLRRLGLRVGDHLRLRTAQGVETFRIGFGIDFSGDAPGADEHLAIMDIANLQHAFGQSGRLTRVDAILREGADPDAVIAGLQSVLPPGVVVQTPDRRGRQIEKMIGAFQLNLTALSLVSLMVGMFLIYNTVAASVVGRRAEIGILRSLGLDGPRVRALFLAEAALLGLAGLGVGLVLGVLLAGRLVGIVSQNITSLYILLSIQNLFISPWLVVAAVFLTFGAVLTAAWFPATEAARVNAIDALTPGFLAGRSARGTRRWTLLGLGFLGLAGALGVVSRAGGPPALSFGTALFTLLGFAFLVPGANRWTATRLPGCSLAGRLALGNFGQSLHRNSITVAAIVTALAMLVGLSVMIHSFRGTVGDWLNRSVRADVFIAPLSSVLVGRREVLSPEVGRAVQNDPGVLALDTYREVRVSVDSRPVKLAAIRFPVVAELNPLPFVAGDGTAVLREAARQGDVVVSESCARKFRIASGGTISLPTRAGPKPFRVAGVFYDYTSDSGLVLMDAATFAESYGETGPNSLAVYLKPDADPEAVRARLRAALAPLGDFLIYSNRELRTEVFRIFDQTFAVTHVLQTIGILISGLGTLLSLGILVAERRREIGILRAQGASRGQVRAVVLIEAGLIGGVGSVLGLAAGLALAVVLTEVINIAFFGWTIRMSLPWGFLLSLPPAVLATAVFSGLLPATAAARADIAAAVKME
jgi:putative ABC transport system permease protein